MFTFLQNLLTSTTINTIFITCSTMMQSARVVDNLISSLVKYFCLFKNIFRYIVGKLIFSIVTRARFSMVYFFERIYLTLTSIFFYCYPVSCCINISMQCTIKIPFKVRRLFNIYLPLLKI